MKRVEALEGKSAAFETSMDEHKSLQEAWATEKTEMVAKFEEIQTALTKSNETIDGISGAIEKSKTDSEERIAKIEKVVASVSSAFENIGKRLGFKTSLEIEKLDDSEPKDKEDYFGKAMKLKNKK